MDDDALDRPTPCPAYPVRDILAHLDGLSLAFTAAAAKDFGELTDTAPSSREVVLHGWDLAKGTGQDYEPDPATAAVVNGFLTESRKDEVPESLFGPVVEIDEDAQTFDHALGLAGRDPGWQPS